VVAGPGSGKTEILSLRVANILQKTDTKPSNILCLTFTESAAVNMRERLSKLIGQDAYRVTIYTFHSFGSDIIGKYPEYFYNGASFSPADKLMQMEVMTEIFNSLPLNNPLKVEHPEQGYIYLESALKAISGLKKTGLMPEEFEQILAENSEFYKKINPLLQVFDDRISEKIYGDIKKLIKELKSFKTEKNNFGVRPLSQIVADSLERALEKCQEDENTKALSAWKEKWIKKDENGKRVFKDFLNVEKLASLSKIYKKYLESMYLKGYYDFDDMLLQTIHCLEKNPVLKYELQEQYQYILVDEFQDTNEAQMRLLRIIADAEVNEGRPNIMAVGDDDQAVYKFQGAEISNILDFRDSFDGVKIVTLKNNYRSTQDILDVATHVIRKGEERLENVVPEIQKTIVASNKNIKG
jgi:DNA helicase-2/ATP-dependent DNA helicase PcrA